MHHDYLIPMNQTFNITSELPLVTCNLYTYNIYLCLWITLHTHTHTNTHTHAHIQTFNIYNNTPKVQHTNLERAPGSAWARCRCPAPPRPARGAPTWGRGARCRRRPCPPTRTPPGRLVATADAACTLSTFPIDWIPGKRVVFKPICM